MTAVLIPDAPAPGSEAWLQYMTGSKIAAVMRLSPYESAYSLWHRMAGVVPPQAEQDVMRRGHYLEPGILAWLADRHPELELGPGGMWASVEQPQFAVTPDALATDPATGELIVAEAKSALDKDVWGEELSDEIPVYYRCQVMWALGILGLRRALVGVLTSFLEFREYEVIFDPAEFGLLVNAADAFMASLERREPPDIDSHSQTYDVIRQLHPEIEETDVELGDELGRRYVNAQIEMRHAEAEMTTCRSLVAAALGSGHRALWNGQRVAYRRAGRSGHPPYLTVVSHLVDKYDRPDLKEAI